MRGKHKGGAIDTVMQSMPPVPTRSSHTDGQMNEGPIGPKGVDGGVPLKFYDTAIKKGGTMPISPPMTAMPAAKTGK